MGTDSDRDTGITVVIPARNEEDRIAHCVIDALTWADAVIVVTEGNSDETAEVARNAGAVVFEPTERDLSKYATAGRIENAFRYGMDRATTGFGVRLDADESPSPAARRLMRRASIDGRFSAISMRRRYYFFGDWLRFGGWYRPEQVAFVRIRDIAESWPSSPHEQINVSGQVHIEQDESVYIDHFDYESVSQFVSRSLHRYALEDAQTRIRKGLHSSFTAIVLRPLRRFVGRFFVRQGYRDGFRGLVVACLLATYDLIVAAQMWDLQRVASQEADDESDRQ